jgi:uncharacterized membrane protein
MNGTRHRQVDEYLQRLDRSMRDLRAERRDEILTEIGEHISELLAENPAATDAEVRNVLERVGDPEDIAAEASDRLGTRAVARSDRFRTSWTDIAAVALLVLGTLLITPFYRPEAMVVAWTAALVLVWMSDVWSTRDKIGVTLLLPAGALSAILIQDSGDEGIVYFAIIVLAAIWPPSRLGLMLRHARRQ